MALEMLGAAIQNGLDQQNPAKKGDDVSSTGGSQKRKLEIDSSNEAGEQQNKQEEEKDETLEPTAKKMRTEAAQ